MSETSLEEPSNEPLMAREEEEAFDQFLSNCVSAFDDSPFFPFKIEDDSFDGISGQDPPPTSVNPFLGQRSAVDVSAWAGSPKEGGWFPSESDDEKENVPCPDFTLFSEDEPGVRFYKQSTPWRPQSEMRTDPTILAPIPFPPMPQPETPNLDPAPPTSQPSTGGASDLPRQWVCHICHKSFRHQYVLTRHLPVHTDVRNFKCDTCGKAFRQMSTLSQHRVIHTNTRPHICPTCGKAFNRVSTLISHRKTHTEKKGHQCHVCGKAFHQKGNLRNHIFTHTNERPYKCDLCGKGFNQKSNLMCHKTHTHSEKVQHQCSHCSAIFLRRHNLQRHVESIHGIRCLASPDNRGLRQPVRSSSFPLDEEGIFINYFETPQLLDAWGQGRIPYAELRPLLGTSVLVKVLPGCDGLLVLMPVLPSEMIQRSVSVTHSLGKVYVQVPLVAVVHETIDSLGRRHYRIDQIP